MAAALTGPPVHWYLAPGGSNKLHKQNLIPGSTSIGMCGVKLSFNRTMRLTADAKLEFCKKCMPFAEEVVNEPTPAVQAD